MGSSLVEKGIDLQNLSLKFKLLWHHGSVYEKPLSPCQVNNQEGWGLIVSLIIYLNFVFIVKLGFFLNIYNKYLGMRELNKISWMHDVIEHTLVK